MIFPYSVHTNNNESINKSIDMRISHSWSTFVVYMGGRDNIFNLQFESKLSIAIFICIHPGALTYSGSFTKSTAFRLRF